jgi:hypothetical protein
MSKKYTPESFVLAYRFWSRPSDGLPLDELDDVPDHDLTDRLEAYGRETLTKQFGSIDTWYEHRAADRIAHIERRNSRASRGHVFEGPGPKLARIPELTEAIADERSDERSFLEQLLDETDVIRERTGGMGGYFVVHQSRPQVTPRYFPLHYVMPFDSGVTAREVARYLTSKRVRVGERQSPETWTRFGALRVAELTKDERIQMAEELVAGPEHGLLQSIRLAERVLADAGAIDLQVGVYRGGVTPGQWDLLVELDCDADRCVTQAELAKRVGVSASKVQKDIRILRDWPGTLVDSGEAGCWVTDAGRRFVERWR